MYDDAQLLQKYEGFKYEYLHEYGPETFFQTKSVLFASVTTSFVL